MKKILFGMLLVWGVSLTPLNAEMSSIKTAGIDVSTAAAVTEVSSETAKLPDYFDIETPTLQKAGQVALIRWQKKLQISVSELDLMISEMADDQVVTGYELSNLHYALMDYDNLRSSANEKLAFYGLNISENERARVYKKLTLIQPELLSEDDKKESIKRFFVNLTGKDIKVKMSVPEKLGLTFMGSAALFILIVAL